MAFLISLLFLGFQPHDDISQVLSARSQLKSGVFEFACKSWKEGMPAGSSKGATLFVTFAADANKTDIVFADASQFERELGITGGKTKYFYVLTPTNGDHITGSAFSSEKNEKTMVRRYDPRALGISVLPPLNLSHPPFDDRLARGDLTLTDERKKADRIVRRYRDPSGNTTEYHFSPTDKKRLLMIRLKFTNGAESDVTAQFAAAPAEIPYPERVTYQHKRKGVLISWTEVLVRKAELNKKLAADTFAPEKAGLNIGQSVAFEGKGPKGNSIFFWDGKEFVHYVEYHKRMKMKKVADGTGELESDGGVGSSSSCRSSCSISSGPRTVPPRFCATTDLSFTSPPMLQCPYGPAAP